MAQYNSFQDPQEQSADPTHSTKQHNFNTDTSFSAMYAQTNEQVLPYALVAPPNHQNFNSNSLYTSQAQPNPGLIHSSSYSTSLHHSQLPSSIHSSMHSSQTSPNNSQSSYNQPINPNTTTLAHPSSFSQQFQDLQSASPERKQAIKKFANRLKKTSILTLPFSIILTFTAFWWVTFLILCIVGCTIVYYRAAPKNQNLSISIFFCLLIANELKSIALIIYYFVKIVKLTDLEIAVIVVAFFDSIIAGPLNLSTTYWLLKSIQLDVYFLSQANLEDDPG